MLRGQKGDLQGAIEDFTRAIEADPAYRDPYLSRAVAFTLLGRHDLALADSRRAVALEPANPENHALHDAMGVNLQSLGRHGEAVAEHDLAIRMAPPADPRVVTYFMNRGLARMGAGDRQGAIQDVAEAQRRGAQVGPEILRELGIAPGSP